MIFDSFDAARDAGFVGFRNIGDLQANKCREVPCEAGVYLVMRNPAHTYEFLAVSCGGHFRGKDPTVPVSRLQEHWVKDAHVLYIGKAGGGDTEATLRERLQAYMRFGDGRRASHSGGRFIWQLTNCLELVVCWKPSGEQDAIELEDELIEKFVSVYGKRPFANLQM